MRTMPAPSPAATRTELIAIDTIVTTRDRRGRGGSGVAADDGGTGHSGGGFQAGTPRSAGVGPPGNIESLVSTFFVTLTVVVLAIGGAMAVAIKDPDQPATLRAHRPRAPRPP